MIIDVVRDEIINRSNNFVNETKGTKDEYNIYEEHVKFVYDYVIKISLGKDVDLEVLKLAALLHDIAMTDTKCDRSRHNEYGALMAEKILKDNNISQNKIDLVVKCILNHSSNRKNFRTTLEEELLVSADCLSHFDNISSLYSLAYNVMGLSETESVEFVKDKLTRDYNELSLEFKPLIIEKYEQVMNAVTTGDLFR